MNHNKKNEQTYLGNYFAVIPMKRLSFHLISNISPVLNYPSFVFSSSIIFSSPRHQSSCFKFISIANLSKNPVEFLSQQQSAVIDSVQDIIDSHEYRYIFSFISLQFSILFFISQSFMCIHCKKNLSRVFIIFFGGGCRWCNGYGLRITDWQPSFNSFTRSYRLNQ